MIILSCYAVQQELTWQHNQTTNTFPGQFGRVELVRKNYTIKWEVSYFNVPGQAKSGVTHILYDTLSYDGAVLSQTTISVECDPIYTLQSSNCKFSDF